MVAEQKEHFATFHYDELCDVFKKRDYKGCTCGLYELQAALNAMKRKDNARLKMGDRAEGTVDKLRREKAELTDEVRRLKEDNKYLERIVNQQEAGCTDREVILKQ